MSLFRRRSERRAVTEDDVPWTHGGQLGTSPMTVERAVRLAPVFAAGNLLAGAIAGLPLQAYRRNGDQRTKMELPRLLRKPAVQGERHDWLYRCVISLVYRGNAVGLITSMDGFGYPTTVEWLNPDDVFVQDSNPSGSGSYANPTWYYRGAVVPSELIVHIPWFVLPGKVWGLTPVEAYATTVNMGLSAQDYKADWFGKGNVPKGHLRNTAKTLQTTEADAVKQRFKQSIKGGDVFVSGSDWEYNSFSVSGSDAQFIETMRLTATQIATIYGIPPEMIGGETGKSMTYQNVEQQSINFVQFTLLPWLTRLESAFSALVPESQYVRFNVNGFIRADLKTRYEAHHLAITGGWMTRDEVREFEDREPLPDGKGKGVPPLANEQPTTSRSDGSWTPLRAVGDGDE